MRYEERTYGKGFLFKKHHHYKTKVYTDVDWAESAIDRRSTSGYYSFVGGNLACEGAKNKNVVARSNAQAEFRALAHRIC